MPPVGFEPTMSASERPQTYALDRAATETGNAEVLEENLIQMPRFPPQIPNQKNVYFITQRKDRKGSSQVFVFKETKQCQIPCLSLPFDIH